VHAAFNALTRGVVTTNRPPEDPTATADPGTPPPPPVVAIANGLFVRNGLRPSPTFLRTLGEQYGAAPQEVDFASPTAKQQIDAWVREQTADRIDELFDELDPMTIAVLANAVYLKASWQVPFDEGLTEDEAFHRADGSTVDVPMMHLARPEQLRYLRTPDWEAVRLPYAGDQLAMWVMIPTDAATTPRFDWATLDRAELRTVDLALPRWDFATEVALLPTLERLGLTDLTDLPGISDSAVVDDAIHRATITVDEFGTEAAAVTGIAVVESAPSPDITVRADRPFAFAITHEPTGAPVFLGTVTDPS
jgi:serpin B